MADPKDDTEKGREEEDSKKGADDTGQDSGADEDKNKAKDKEEGKLLTEKEAQAIADRAVSKAAEKWAAKQTEAVEAARKEAEESALQEKGEFEELYTREKERAEKLAAQVKDREFKEKAEEVLREAGVENFRAVLLAPRATLEDIAEAGGKLKELFDTAVEAEVLRRLDTGNPRPKGKGGVSAVTKLSDLKSDAEKAAYVEEHGAEAYKKLVLKAASGD